MDEQRPADEQRAGSWEQRPAVRPPAPGPSGAKGSARRDAYRAAGVDVEAGERAVALMRDAVASTWRRGVVGGPGGFAGAMELPEGYRRPLLVASTDGVGTKVALARRAGRLGGLGIDLVAMCADDVACAGAEPLFLLDYVAVGRVVPDEVAALVGSVAAGCRLAGCALLGGETAEHPGVMRPDDLDLAATCVGVVERDDLLDGGSVVAGDLLLGLPSSGLHSNGFSLVRRLVDEAGLDLEAPYAAVLARHAPGVPAEGAIAERPLADVLLEPTRVYARPLLAIRAAIRAGVPGGDVHGIAHVTGGGLPGNVPRIVPDGLAARVDPARWAMPSVMRLLGAVGGLEDRELRATFNGGIGMVLALPPAAVGSGARSCGGAGDPGDRDRRGGERRRDGRAAIRGGGLMGGRIAVGVSGSGSNLRALAARIERGALDAEIALVFADRRLRGDRVGSGGGLRDGRDPGPGCARAGGPRGCRRGARRDGRRHASRRGRPCRDSCAWWGRVCWRRSRAGCSTSTRRSCRHSPARTRSATRWRPGPP